MSFLRFIIGVSLIVAISVVAFMNNDMVSINLWPFYITITASLSVVIVVLVLFGYIIGKIDSWMAYSPLRTALRSQRRQNKKLNAEQQKLVEKVEGLKENLENIKTADSAFHHSDKPSSGSKIKQKISGLFKRRPQQDDFWCL